MILWPKSSLALWYFVINCVSIKLTQNLEQSHMLRPHASFQFSPPSLLSKNADILLIYGRSHRKMNGGVEQNEQLCRAGLHQAELSRIIGTQARRDR